MKIKFSKHAKLKIEERRINLEDIKKVLKNAELIFYDIVSKSFVSIGKIEAEK